MQRVPAIVEIRMKDLGVSVRVDVVVDIPDPLTVEEVMADTGYLQFTAIEVASQYGVQIDEDEVYKTLVRWHGELR